MTSRWRTEDTFPNETSPMTPPLMTSLIWQVSLELEAKVSELHEARADLKAARKAAARAQVSLVNGH